MTYPPLTAVQKDVIRAAFAGFYRDRTGHEPTVNIDPVVDPVAYASELSSAILEVLTGSRKQSADKTVSVRAAARYFDVSEKTIYRWIHSGRLDAERVGPLLLRVDLTSVKRTKVQPLDAEVG